MKKVALALAALAFAAALPAQDAELRSDAGAEVLSFKYKKGDSYRILSKVSEDVFINGQKANRSEIVNRISVRVNDAFDDGSGALEGTFMTSEQATAEGSGALFNFGEEFKSAFTRAKNGRYTIDEKYFMPIVRDVPIFPDTPVKPGDKWSADGYEAEDLRRSFNIQSPFKVPFEAAYEYLGTTTSDDGRVLNVISVDYDLFYESPKMSAKERAKISSAEFLSRPAVTRGWSRQIIRWDNERGEIDRYTDEFKIVIETYYGDVVTFQGTSEAEVTDFTREKTEDVMEKVSGAIDELGLENVTVKRGDKGVTISVEKIQFLPDSSELRESEKAKLEKIAQVLKGCDNDLLVSGHCAARGTAKERKRISEERAQSVARYLVESGARDVYHVFTQGKGSSEPIADNGTEEGRAANRRVEITLMDN